MMAASGKRAELLRSLELMLPPSRMAAELAAIQREMCARSLLAFVRLFWPVVEPARPMVDGWWLEAWCRHLEAVTDGRITRLLGNCPPGFMKSLLTNVFWPAWEWGPRRMPWQRYVTFSYSQHLTVRDNQRMIAVVLSPLYRQLWGDVFQATENKIKFENNQTGWKFASSVGGVGTGERGDRLIIDDPNNVKEAESETVRSDTNRWLREVMPSRLNDPVNSAIVVIQQRTHEEDASGTLLASKATKWVHVMVPMRFEPHRKCKTPIWEDPRTKAGELAWPERFPAAIVERDEAELGPYAAAGQFQQSPSPRGGSIIKREWWQVWPPAGEEEKWRYLRQKADGSIVRAIAYPEFDFVLAALDHSYKQKEENDYCAMTTWGVFADKAGRPKIMLTEAWRDRLQLHELCERAIETCERRGVDTLLIGGSGGSGHWVAQEIRRLMRGHEWRIIVEDERVDKTARMHAIVPTFAGDLVYAPQRKWADMVISEVAQFPRGKHDDLCDTVSLSVGWMRRVGLAKLMAEADEERLEEMWFQGRPRSIAEEMGVA